MLVDANRLRKAVEEAAAKKIVLKTHQDDLARRKKIVEENRQRYRDAIIWINQASDREIENAINKSLSCR